MRHYLRIAPFQHNNIIDKQWVLFFCKLQFGEPSENIVLLTCIIVEMHLLECIL